ncbi:MAG: thiamine ABC transporter substrate-binding protein [Bdellovibrionales bacterium]|nr:thiamine ABC transporter substrate-binding protein [Bdellovibrionales bacterium]
MKSKIWLFFFTSSFLFLTGLFYISLRRPLAPATLKVLTYSSFAGAYGPGPLLKEEFEKKCSCRLQWFLSEDSTSLLQRFTILRNIDVVLGWDQITKLSLNKENWKDLSFLKKYLLENPFLNSPFFIPFDWSPIGFIYKDDKYKISSFSELKDFSGWISFPEPRTSNLGLQFYYWIYEWSQGDLEKISLFLKQIQNKIYGSVPSWSLSYGFFRKGQTQLSLSYLSSLLYHQKEEPGQDYFFAEFKEGHPYQVEFFSISESTKNKDLALQFARLLLSEKGQKILLNRHYMFPVSKSFEKKDKREVSLLDYNRLEEFIDKKQDLLNLWDQSFN